MSRGRLRTLGVGLVAAIALAACGTDDGTGVRGGGGSGSGSGSASGSGVASGSVAEAACEPVGDAADADAEASVALTEWAVAVGGEIPAGTVALTVSNTGNEPHELLIVRAADAADLPVDEDGSFAEDDMPAGDVIGEVEAFPAGETCTGVFDLTPGDYVFLCNLVEEVDGSVESHFELGMATAVTVGG